MADIKLEDLYFSIDELKDIIQLVAKKNIKNYKNKSSDRLYKIFKKQSKNKKRIDDIRNELKDPTYNISKSKSKDIKKSLYNIEKRNIIGSKKTTRYLDKLDKKILKLDKYHDHDDYEYKGIKYIKDLFKLSINKDHYKPTLVKSGYNGNYVQYESKRDKILSLKEYLALIESYLRELINYYKNKREWKVQLIAEISFISLKPGSDETRIMHFIDMISIFYHMYFINSPKWLKDKKSTINPKNNDDKCFQYAVTLALNLDNIDNHPERISKIEPFIDHYSWKDINFPSTSKNWTKIRIK